MIDRQLETMSGAPQTSAHQRPSLFSPNGNDRPARRILLVSVTEGERVVDLPRLLLAGLESHEVNIGGSLATAISILDQCEIDAIVLALDPTGHAGLQACHRLHEAAPEIPIVAISRSDDERIAIGAIANGAQDCLVQDEWLESLLPRAIGLAIERIRRHLPAERHRRDGSHDSRAAARFARLTARQRQITDLLIRGKSVKEIAAQLQIGVRAATKHRARILRKCEVDSVVHLVRLQVAAGLSIE
jgi:DNA-binding NarL/FixJ family response regulator